MGWSLLLFRVILLLYHFFIIAGWSLPDLLPPFFFVDFDF